MECVMEVWSVSDCVMECLGVGLGVSRSVSDSVMECLGVGLGVDGVAKRRVRVKMLHHTRATTIVTTQ